MTRMFRQGDVLLVQVSKIPESAQVSSDNVLARGEVTGHSHRINGQASVFRVPTRVNFPQGDHPEQIYLSVTSAELVHDEHAPITIPEGLYEVRRQREYEPGMVRYLQD